MILRLALPIILLTTAGCAKAPGDMVYPLDGGTPIKFETYCANMPMPEDGAEMNIAQTECASARPVQQIPGVECSTEKLGGLIGKAQSRETEAEALRLSGAKSVRWLGPNSVATMDFRPDRLNLNTDAEGKIASARCG